MTPVNPLDGIGAILKADDTVQALADGRVYWPKLPREANNGMPKATVVIRPGGGDVKYGSGMLELTDPRIYTDCYGATAAQSWQLNLAVHAALKRTIRTVAGGVLVHSIGVTLGGTTGEDPDTKWPLTIAIYTAVVSELPITA